MRNLFLFTTLFLCATQTFGQVRADLNTGVNFSTVRVSNYSAIEPDYLAGGFIGFSVSTSLSPSFDFVSNYQFSQLGYANTNRRPNFLTKHRISYFILNPEIKYTYLKPLTLAAGLSVGSKLIEKTKEYYSKTWQSSLKDRGIKQIDFGTTFNISLDFDRIAVFGRFYYGVVNIIQNRFLLPQTFEPYVLYNMNNMNFQIGLAYRVL